jgi:hypothetical protein
MASVYPYPVAFVLGGSTHGADHYATYADSLSRLLEMEETEPTSSSEKKEKKFLVKVFEEVGEAVNFLHKNDGHSRFHEGTLVFVSVGQQHLAEELAERYKNLHVVVLSGVMPPVGKPVTVYKNIVNRDNVGHLVLPQ